MFQKILPLSKNTQSLYDVWEKFKLLLRRCHDQNMDYMEQMQHLARGSQVQTRILIDA